MEKELLSTTELAALLGISRIAVFKKIKSGAIKAKKTGRNYVIQRSDLPEILGTVLTRANKRQIELAVKKTILEYGDTLRLLGQE